MRWEGDHLGHGLAHDAVVRACGVMQDSPIGSNEHVTSVENLFGADDQTTFESMQVPDTDSLVA